MSAPHILRLKIERFRGIAEIDWQPGPGFNLILYAIVDDPFALLTAGVLFNPTGLDGLVGRKAD